MADSEAILKAIANRLSVRKYQDRPVPKEAVEIILKAAMAAPSAKNVQPWRFAVINRREILDQLADALQFGKMLRHAPLAIAVIADMEESEEGTPGFDYWKQDCAAATMNLLLAVEALDLGAVWLGVTPVPERIVSVRRILTLPETRTPFCIVSIGYPEGDDAPKDKFDAEKVDWSNWSD